MSPVSIGPERQAFRHGVCCFCLRDIEPGELICPVDLEWAHLECVDRELW